MSQKGIWDILSDKRDLTSESPAPAAQGYYQCHREARPLPHEVVFKIPIQRPVFLPEQAVVHIWGPTE